MWGCMNWGARPQDLSGGPQFLGAPLKEADGLHTTKLCGYGQKCVFPLSGYPSPRYQVTSLIVKRATDFEEVL